jgi:hypothetical protein
MRFLRQRPIRAIGGYLLASSGIAVLTIHAVALPTGGLSEEDVWQLPFTFCFSTMLVTGGLALARRLSRLPRWADWVFVGQASLFAAIALFWSGWVLLAAPLKLSGPYVYESNMRSRVDDPITIELVRALKADRAGLEQRAKRFRDQYPGRSLRDIAADPRQGPEALAALFGKEAGRRLAAEVRRGIGIPWWTMGKEDLGYSLFLAALVGLCLFLAKRTRRLSGAGAACPY